MLKVTLFRLLPFPSWKRVTVARITVRGFREALRVGLARLLEWSAGQPGKPTPEAGLQCLGDPTTVAALADLVCVAQRPRFFRRWHSQRNAVRLMRASREVEGVDPDGWGRMLALIDWGGERVKKGGGLVSDIAAICRIYGMTPVQVLDMPMQDFLDICDCTAGAAKAAEEAEILEDPTMDPNAKPTPLTNVPGGRGKVWIN
jgi:hypothetical protein